MSLSRVFALVRGQRLGWCLFSLVAGVNACLAVMLGLSNPAGRVWATPAATILINPGESIQAALDSAADGDTLLILPGTYTESLTLNKAVSLMGVPTGTTTIVAVSSQRVITVTGAAISNTVVISGLTFTGGHPTGGVTSLELSGGGMLIVNDAHPALQNVILSNNIGLKGGGLRSFLLSGSLTLTNVSFINNLADGEEGGGAHSNVPLTLVDSLFQGNTSNGGDGGGLYIGAGLTLTGTHFISNTTSSHGGGLYSPNSLTFSGSLFQGNSAGGYGGGVGTFDGLALTDTQFISNTAGVSGGGAHAGGAATLSGGLFQGNSSGDEGGGGVFANSTLTINGTQFISNTSSTTGGGAHTGGATLNGGLFQGNSSGGDGGGVFAYGLTMSGTHFISNTANGGGGGLAVFGNLTVSGTHFINNTASGNGGGLYSFGGSTSLIQTSLFQDNSAGNAGGGLLIDATNTFTLSGNQILDNQAALDGGGIYFSANVLAYLDNNVIAANTVLTDTGAAELSLTASGTTVVGRHNTFASATPGSGLALKAGDDSLGETIVLTNTIFDGYALSVRAGPFTPTIILDSVLWSNVTTPTQGSGITVTNGLNGSAAFVSPTARDYHLTGASDAIDAGVEAGLFTDFEGDVRPLYDGFDIGFDEANLLPTLDFIKSVSLLTAGPGQTLTYTLAITASYQTLTPTITDTLPAGLTYINGSLTGGGTYSNGQITFTGPITPGVPLTLTYAVTVSTGIAPGAILVNQAVATYAYSSATYTVERTASVAIPESATIPNLVLIYANGDNNLSTSMLTLLNRAEVAADNPAATILFLLDGPGDADARLYRLEADTDLSCPNYINPTCGGRYVLGENMWAWSDDTANPYSLSEFVKSASLAYPAQQILLSLVGHGSGWFPNLPIGQPSGWDGQPGGLLWDEHPRAFISTKGLGEGLRWAKQATGRSVDLLYLDACLMGMAETAYEVRDSVSYVLASENWSWAAFPYDQFLSASVLSGTANAPAIGAAWLNIEAAMLRSNNSPFTIALAQTSQMPAVFTATNDLGAALLATLPLSQTEIMTAHVPGLCFDNSQDGAIDANDNACDLAGFARHIEQEFAGNSAIVSAAQAVQSAVSASVLLEDHQSGLPWPYPNQNWAWEELGGLSFYLPLRVDDWKRAYYNGEHLAFAQVNQWGTFLNTYWSAAPPEPPPCGGACPPPPSPIGGAPTLFLPLVRR